MSKTTDIKTIAIAIVFVACTYFGFKYDSEWAFAGAVIAFLSLIEY